MSFSIADKPGAIGDGEQDAIQGLMARPDVLSVRVLGRNADGEVVLSAQSVDPDAVDGPVVGSGVLTTRLLISDETDGTRISRDGVTYLFEPDVVL